MAKTMSIEGGLATTPDLFQVLGVSRSRAEQLYTRPDFPKPVTETVTGRAIYRVRDVERWNKRRPSR